MGQQSTGRVTKEGPAMNESTSPTGVAMIIVGQADAAALLLLRTPQAPTGAYLVSAKTPNCAHQPMLSLVLELARSRWGASVSSSRDALVAVRVC